jgi:hypothetical protein
MDYLLKNILKPAFRAKMKRVVKRRGIALVLSLILGES